jgi:predicted negative regulator of RcsB-dependent stress response
MQLHPDPWIALAWTIALAVGVVMAVLAWVRWRYWRRFRWNVKARAVLRTLSNGTETMHDRETKLPPIL